MSRGDIEIEKVKTGDNVADLLTKHQNSEAIEKHLQSTNARIGGERSAAMPKLTESAVNLVEVIDPHLASGRNC